MTQKELPTKLLFKKLKLISFLIKKNTIHNNLPILSKTIVFQNSIAALLKEVKNLSAVVY